jgi:hypothetical protein
MNAEELDRFVAEVVERSPETPRDFDRGPLLVHCTLNLPSAVMIAAGVATLSIVARFSFTGELAPGQVGSITAFHLVMGGLGFGLILLPLLVYARFVGVLRRGVLTTARVVESQAIDREVDAPGAPAHRVVGRRIVDHPLGAFEQPFRSDRPFAPALLPGVEMGVLVHPRKPLVLRDLGPIR